MTTVNSPIPLSELESVLAWVDTFKLSRPTRKINRDFSDAVLLAEILAVHYPKLVEMHNYPPRNSHALKLNNWMTLNRKVLKKLKLNLCVNTMEQLSNCAPGLIERVLVMVREKIQRDEEINSKTRDAEQNMSSGGSYYEALGDDEQIMIIPVKTRVNGVLETIQQKVISYEIHSTMKEELKDAKESSETLRQKVDHLSNLLKLKEERIEELQKQLERKQSRRKEAENLQNSLSVPFEPLSPHNKNDIVNQVASVVKEDSVVNKSLENLSESSEVTKLASNVVSDTKINETIDNFNLHPKMSITNEVEIPVVPKKPSERSSEMNKVKSEESKIPIKIAARQSIIDVLKAQTVEPVISTSNTEPSMQMMNSDPSISEVTLEDINKDPAFELDRVKSDVFKEAEAIETNVIGQRPNYDKDEYPAKQSKSKCSVTIEQSIIKEIGEITKPTSAQDYSYFN